jgi:hypothetical protein
MASSSIQLKAVTPAGANVKTKSSSVRKDPVVRISKYGRLIVTPAKLFASASTSDQDSSGESDDSIVQVLPHKQLRVVGKWLALANVHALVALCGRIVALFL